MYIVFEEGQSHIQTLIFCYLNFNHITQTYIQLIPITYSPMYPNLWKFILPNYATLKKNFLHYFTNCRRNCTHYSECPIYCLHYELIRKTPCQLFYLTVKEFKLFINSKISKKWNLLKKFKTCRYLYFWLNFHNHQNINNTTHCFVKFLSAFIASLLNNARSNKNYNIRSLCRCSTT